MLRKTIQIILILLISSAVNSVGNNIIIINDITDGHKINFGKSKNIKNKSNPFLMEADTLKNSGKFYKAIALYRKELKKSEISNNFDEVNNIVFKMAKAYTCLGKYHRAEAMYRRLIRRDFENPVIYLYLGEVLRKSHKYKQAARAFIFYKNLKPHDIRWKYGLANISYTKLLCSIPQSYRMRRVQSIRESDLNKRINTIKDILTEGKLFVDSINE